MLLLNLILLIDVTFSTPTPVFANNSYQTQTFVVADQFYLIALGIGDIERPPMYPRVFSGFDLKPQSLQSFLFSLEIGKRYFESDVVDGGSCGVRP